MGKEGYERHTKGKEIIKVKWSGKGDHQSITGTTETSLCDGGSHCWFVSVAVVLLCLH